MDKQELDGWAAFVGITVTIMAAIWAGLKFVFDRGKGFAQINAQIDANTKAIADLATAMREQREAQEESERKYLEWRDKLNERHMRLESAVMQQGQAIESLEGNVVRLISQHD